MKLRELGIPVIKITLPGRAVRQRPNGLPFKKGNRAAAKALMSEDSHKRRINGLLKAWSVKSRIEAGEKIVPHRAKTRKRAKLRMTLAKEAREIQNLARQHADQAMVALAEIINSKTAQDSIKVAAASVIFDRAYGKASQTNINANIDADGKPSEISAKQLDERVAEVLKRVETLTGGAPKAPKSKKRPPDLRKLDPDPNGTTQH